MRKVIRAIAGGTAALAIAGGTAAVILTTPVSDASPGCTNDRGTKICTTVAPATAPNTKWSVTSTFTVKGNPDATGGHTTSPVGPSTKSNPGGQVPPGQQ
jgi:hypothetical protein